MCGGQALQIVDGGGGGINYGNYYEIKDVFVAFK
jgi:hypothetical protein